MVCPVCRCCAQISSPRQLARFSECGWTVDAENQVGDGWRLFLSACACAIVAGWLCICRGPISFPALACIAILRIMTVSCESHTTRVHSLPLSIRHAGWAPQVPGLARLIMQGFVKGQQPAACSPTCMSSIYHAMSNSCSVSHSSCPLGSSSSLSLFPIPCDM